MRAISSRIALAVGLVEREDRREAAVERTDAARVPLRAPSVDELVLDADEPGRDERRDARFAVECVPRTARPRPFVGLVSRPSRSGLVASMNASGAAAVTEQRPPDRAPAARPQRREEASRGRRPRPPSGTTMPLRRGRTRPRLELRLLERARRTPAGLPNDVLEVVRQRRVRLDGDERVGSELEQPSESPVPFPGRSRARSCPARGRSARRAPRTRARRWPGRAES